MKATHAIDIVECPSPVEASLFGAQPKRWTYKVHGPASMTYEQAAEEAQRMHNLCKRNGTLLPGRPV